MPRAVGFGVVVPFWKAGPWPMNTVTEPLGLVGVVDEVLEYATVP
jgi:hypothetical protein